MADLTMTGGDVVTPGGVRAADIVIEDGRIRALRRRRGNRGAGLDVSGCLVFPGGVDPHTHLLADVERATLAALHGGTTTAFTFPLPRAGEGTVAATRRARREIERRALIAVGIHASYLDPQRTSRRELERLAALGAFGVQAFTSFPELGLMFTDGQLYRLLGDAAHAGLVPQVQCEDGSLIAELELELLRSGQRDVTAFPRSRPAAAEEQAAYAALGLARLAATRVYLVHLSTARSLALVRAARGAGQEVALELCTHHLLLDERAYAGPRGERFVVAPPLRPRTDVAALWRALRAGTSALIGSDHAEGLPAAPATGADFTALPMGFPGIELRMPLLLSAGLARGIAPERLAELLSSEAARVFGLFPRKGAIVAGADADLLVWDPRRRWTVATHALRDGADEGPYAGIVVRGAIRYVLVAGTVAIADGALAERPRGRLLEGPGSAPPV